MRGHLISLGLLGAFLTVTFDMVEPPPPLGEEAGVGEAAELPEFEKAILGPEGQEAWPGEPTTFDSNRVSFWNFGPIPAGSVLTFLEAPEKESDQPAIIAVFVVSAEEKDSEGIKIQVRTLGSDKSWGKSWAVGQFSRRKNLLHICRGGELCLQPKLHHITEFHYWPVGRFNANYVDKRCWREYRKFVESLDDPAPPEAAPAKEGDAEERLSLLRRRLLQAKGKSAPAPPRSVSFPELPKGPGILKRRKSGSAVKREIDEALEISSESEVPSQKKMKALTSAKGVGSALYAAIERQNQSGLASSDLVPSRSSRSPKGSVVPKKSKKKKKKKSRRRRRSSSSDGSSSASSHSSSNSSLKPPLQKKAEKRPGSVFRLLLNHVRLSLSDLSLADPEDQGGAAAVNSSAKVTSYFQIMVRPHLASRPRDEKELYSLAVALDTLRSGNLEKIADLLAGRYMAVETAAFDGNWDTARWLEVAKLEEKGSAPTEILLAARRHQRTVDRASGRGSYGRSETVWGAGYSSSGGHWDDWSGAGRGKGKKGKSGKGKGKKGKAGKKGSENPWWDDPAKDPGKLKDDKKGEGGK